MRFGHQHQRVATRDAAQHSELIAGDEYLPRGDSVRPQVSECPSGGVGLVGEANLDVLGIAGDPCVHQPRLIRCGLGDRHHVGYRTDPGRLQSLLHGCNKLRDVRLEGISPLSDRDDIDLPAIEALCHDRGFEAAHAKPLDRQRRGPVKLRVLGGRRHPSLKQCHAILVASEDF